MIRWRACLMVTLVISTACSSSAGMLDEAHSLRRAGKSHEALKKCQEALVSFGDGSLPEEEARLRLKALQLAADLCYLELADFGAAIAYYRRIISLYPKTSDAYKARANIGDIYLERQLDRHAAIAQYADIASSDWKDAPVYQLKVAQTYLALRNTEQARTEARLLTERWPQSPLADDALLLTAQAWALQKRPKEALRAFLIVTERKPRAAIAAQALEGQARIYAERGGTKNLDRAIDLYAQALASHPNRDAVRVDLEAARRRREALKPVKLGERGATFNSRVRDPWNFQEIP
jgi:tetratricopeptide (TPR) repeat protein